MMVVFCAGIAALTYAVAGPNERDLSIVGQDELLEAAPHSADAETCAFVVVRRSCGQLSITGTSVRNEGDGVERATLEVADDEGVLGELCFTVDSTTGVYVPVSPARGESGVRLWGTDEGLAALGRAMPQLRFGVDETELAMGINVLLHSTVPQGEAFEAVAAFDLPTGMVVALVDAKGLLGVLCAGDWQPGDGDGPGGDVSGPLLSSSDLSPASDLSAVIDAATAVEAKQTCCVTCGDSECCCQGETCSTTGTGTNKRATCKEGNIATYRCGCTDADNCDCQSLTHTQPSPGD